MRRGPGPHRPDRTRPGRAHAIGPVLVVTAALALTACGAATSTGDGSASGGMLQVAVQFAPKAGYAIDSDDAFLLTSAGAVETLVAAGSDAVPKPALATSWKRVDDLHWQFTLRSGVRFQDGSAFDAAAVVTALSHVAGVDAPPRSVDGIGLTAEATGPSTVTVGTTTPDPVLPLRMSSPNTAILSAAAYASTPPAVIGTGTGPFTLTATSGTASATVVRNDTYWGPKARLDGAVLRYIPDPASRLAAVQAGDVQIAQGVPPSSLPEIEGSGSLKALQYQAPRTTSVYLNQKVPALQDQRVRQAITAAIDRPALVASVLEGTGRAASEQFGDAVPFGTSASPRGADPTAAAALLAAAGHTPQNPLSLRLWTYSDRPELPDLATAIQTMLQRAGIATTIRIGEYASFQDDIDDGSFDLFILSRSYLTDFPDAGGFLASDYGCSGTFNLNSYCSAAFDALLDRLTTTTDAASRIALFRQAAQLLTSQYVGVPLLHTGSISAVDAAVQDYTPDPLDQLLLTTTMHLAK